MGIRRQVVGLSVAVYGIAVRVSVDARVASLDIHIVEISSERSRKEVERVDVVAGADVGEMEVAGIAPFHFGADRVAGVDEVIFGDVFVFRDTLRHSLCAVIH